MVQLLCVWTSIILFFYLNKTGYINQAQHKPFARVKTNIKELHPHDVLAPMSMHCFTADAVKIRVLSEVMT
jgi:hypothetical protein